MMRLFAHGVHEVLVGLCPAHLVQQEFHAVDGGHGSQDLAQDPDTVEDIVGKQQVFLARSEERRVGKECSLRV